MTTPDDQSAAQRAYPTRYRIYILTLLTAAYVTNYADRSILTTLTEPIKNEFGLSDEVMGLMGGVAFAIFYTTAGLPFAVLADRGNRTKIAALAAGVWSIFTTACAFVTNAWQLFFARVGVGIGEAGGSPPSHAIISDLFYPKQRATALAIYALGVPIGFALGSFIGAPIAQAHGWRAAFLVLGIPGVIISIMIWLTVREPPRGLSDESGSAVARGQDGPPPSLRSVLGFMLTQPALLHVLAGATIVTTVGYAGVNWNAAFLMRSHHLTLTEVGFYLGMVAIFGSVSGTFLGGILADQLGKLDRRWNTWIVALFFAISMPISAYALSINDTQLVLWILPVPTFVAGLYLGPTFAMVQNLVGVRMRALAAAILLFSINLVGMSVGPWLTGRLSDYFKPEYGDRSLQHALFLMSFLSIWGIAHYVLAGRTLVTCYKRAETA